MVDTTVLQDCFKGAVRGLISHCGTVNGYIVDIGYGVLWNLWLKDVHHVIIEDGDSVSPTHQEFGEMQCTVRCLESGVVAIGFGKRTFVVAKHSSAGMTCELLRNLVGERSDTRVLDHDGVEGFKTVDRVNNISFFLCYAEPAQAV